jgi:hypothetical protein
MLPVMRWRGKSSGTSLVAAECFRGSISVSQYWISEKLDGFRAYWDGRRLRFRSGNPVPAPSWFVNALPGQELDGELWLGRGTFDQLSARIQHYSPDDTEWHRLRDEAGALDPRPACALLSVARSALHYESRLRQKDATALAAMSILSAQYPRYGYRRIHVFLERQGHRMSIDRAWRLWPAGPAARTSTWR